MEASAGTLRAGMWWAAEVICREAFQKRAVPWNYSVLQLLRPYLPGVLWIPPDSPGALPGESQSQ